MESLHLLFQHLSFTAELDWSQFVNVYGFPGKNIPNDLHMEHLCLIKTALQGLEVNKTEKAITNVDKVLDGVDPVLARHDS